MKKVVMMTLLLAGLAGGVHAQFFKKILDNVKQTAQGRANSKASQTTDKAIDGALQPSAGKTGTGTGASGGADSASLNRVLGAFAGAAKDNPNDTSGADLTMKALNRMIGGGGVSKADSAAAIKLFMTSQGGSGVSYVTTSTITSSKGGNKDTNYMYFTASGEGRSEWRVPIPGMKMGKMVIIARSGQPQYSMNLDDDKKTYSLNVIDTSLINSGRDEYTVTKVGEERVAGYPCTHAKLVSKSRFGGTTMDIWTSTAVPGYAIYKKLLAVNKVTPGMLFSLQKAGCDGFFVKLTTNGKDYSMTMELLRAEEKSLPASMFRIPSGYTETYGGIMGTMMSGMSGAKKN